jgi:hypothetical protein
MELVKHRHAVLVALVAAFGVCAAATTATATTKSAPDCNALQVSTKAKPCHPTGVRCPIISATGVVGLSTNVAGGIAAVHGAYGGLTLDCTAVADGLKVTAPGHKFALVHATTSLDRCTVSGDTITCKLNVAQQRAGLGFVGAWQNAINWRFTPDDAASHDLKYGSCDIPVTITLLNGGTTAYTKGTQTVCMFAAGDVLK